MGIIYKYTNKINNKSYIGQTINPQKRKNYHKSAAFNPNARDYDKKFYRAIRKYTYEEFEYSILEECEDNIINEREKYYIQYYDSVENGYNITYGGEGQQWSEEWKQWFSEQSQFKNASLTLEDIIWIRQCYLDNKKPSEIYPQFQNILTHYYSFMNIWCGQRYSYVMPEVFKIRPNRIKLNMEKAEEIRLLYQEGMSYQQIADIYNVGKCTVRDVIKNKTWKV